MKKPENPPAFPFTWQNRDGEACVESGMSLRDYFAAKAMQGRLSICYNPLTGEKEIDDVNLANEAYRIADAMLIAREK